MSQSVCTIQSLFCLLQQPLYRLQHKPYVDWLGNIFCKSGSKAFFNIIWHGVGAHRYDRNVLCGSCLLPRFENLITIHLG